jgi:predicted PurR-regulated permease PerM
LNFLDLGPFVQVHFSKSASSSVRWFDLLQRGETQLRCLPESELLSLNAVDWQIANRNPPLSIGIVCAALTQEHRIIDFGDHLRTTGGALKNWAVAQAQDSLAVGVLWLLGLYILRIPLAPLWAAIAAVLQIVPHLGPVLGLIGPVLAATIIWRDWERPLGVLMLYAIVVIIDALLLQPFITRRTARVPIWASILAPIVLGMLWPFWGVLVAAPLLAVLYAYKARYQEKH